MRERWREVRLGDLLTLVRRRAVIDPTETYKLVTLPINGVGARLRKEVSGGELGTAKYLVRHGDLMISKIDARKGSNSLLPGELDGAIVTGDFLSYEVDNSLISSEMLDIFVKRREFSELCDTVSSGTTNRVRLDPRRFLELAIKLPPLAEQRRIVDLIGAVDDAIEAAEGEATATEAMARSARKQLLHPDVAWENVTIGDVSRVVTGRSFKAEHQGCTSGVIPYFRVSDMTATGNERELLRPNDWLDEAGVAAVKPVVCPPGTVVFPILGAALATEKRRVLGVSAGFVQHMIGLVPGPQVLSGILLAVMQDVRLADFSQHGAMPSVNQKLVSGITFSLPPLDAQEQIVEQLGAIEAAADAARTHAESLRTLRSNLLTVLLSGEHEIPATYDDLLSNEDVSTAA
ncbi:restriction endonuclease subunit S [Microbacterium esteraromaticum]|uniref:restriction endonuclease subunit S n=1 Tax=Microbacterium esteraromaticum TaxID=57043 RepID=UPI001C98A4C8|nr:restriction endonuclease subunit S [Microbacterium esteraromaticum]MBY6061017.1 restriction endonuclease subunit S [Microbacterium esteraromaticum]